MKSLRRETARLVLRPLKPSDYARWKLTHSTMLDPKNIWDAKRRTDDLLTREKFKQVLQAQKTRRENDSFYDFAVFEKKTGDLIGSVSAMDVLRGVAQTAFLGYGIYNRYWGKGYAKEAVRALIDIAFTDLSLHRLEAGIEPSNRRSIMLARSLKLRKEGLKKRAIYLRETWIDLVMYSATCEDFSYSYRWKKKPTLRLR